MGCHNFLLLLFAEERKTYPLIARYQQYPNSWYDSSISWVYGEYHDAYWYRYHKNRANLSKFTRHFEVISNFSLFKVSVPGNLPLRQGKDIMNQWYFISNTFFPPQKGHPTVLNTVFEWGNLTISSFPSISLIYLFIFQPSTKSKCCPLRLFWWRPKVLRPEIHDTSVQSLLSTQREICDTMFDKNHPKSSLKTNLQGMCDHLQEAKTRRHTNHTSNNMRNTFKVYHQLVFLIFTNCNPCCIWSMLDGLQGWWILESQPADSSEESHQKMKWWVSISTKCHWPTWSKPPKIAEFVKLSYTC